MTSTPSPEGLTGDAIAEIRARAEEPLSLNSADLSETRLIFIEAFLTDLVADFGTTGKQALATFTALLAEVERLSGRVAYISGTLSAAESSVSRLSERAETAERNLHEAHRGMKMVHDSLADPTRPRQSVGEVAAHWLRRLDEMTFEPEKTIYPNDIPSLDTRLRNAVVALAHMLDLFGQGDAKTPEHAVAIEAARDVWEKEIHNCFMQHGETDGR